MAGRRAFGALGLSLVLAVSCGGRSEQTAQVQNGGASGSGGSGGSAGVSGAGVSGAGGAVGAAGVAGSGGGGVCLVDSDCRVYNDCCGCSSLGPEETAPDCLADCATPVCDQFGIPASAARCIFARCVLDRSCSSGPPASCPRLPLPACRAGEIRFFDQDCKSGCIAVDDCSDVASCEVCESAGQRCEPDLFAVRGAPRRFHCIGTFPGCDGGCE